MQTSEAPAFSASTGHERNGRNLGGEEVYVPNATASAKTMSGMRLGDVLVFYHSTAPPSDSEWESVLDLYRKIPDVSKVRTFVYTEGAAPNAAQRARLTAVLRDRKPPMAVVTPSQLARAIGTAIRWFNPSFQVFAPSELEKAFLHLRASAAEKRAIERALAELKSEVRDAIHSSPPPRAAARE